MMKNNYNYLNIIDEFRNKYNNQDIKAILNIDSINLSSLVVQGDDNDYYLSHLENKDDSIYGSLMLDYRTNLDNSKINLIYGHMSYSDYTPFKRLESYLDYNFYMSNPYFTITTDKDTYKYEIFSIAKVNKNETKYLEVNFNEQELLKQYNYFKDISIYQKDILLTSEDNILIMQTCSSNSNEFLLIIARKVIK